MRPRELDIIERVGQLTGQSQALRDDVFWDEATRQIYTTDMLVEGTHFCLDYFSPEDLGWKAAAVNISDVAATGGILKYLLISLALPTSISLDWIESFYTGLSAACRQFGGAVVGGDTVGSDRLTINVTAIGECPQGHTPGHRFQAEAGDYIVATGYHGLSHLGLLALQQHEAGYEKSKARHLRPMPRIQEGLYLSQHVQRYALMDSSDGLADALIKIAQASQKKLLLEGKRLPIHPEVQAYSQTHGISPWSPVLYGGEDFELVATVPALDGALLEHFHVIGRVYPLSHTTGHPEGDTLPGAYFQDPEDPVLQPLSLEKTFQHFETQEAPRD